MSDTDESPIIAHLPGGYEVRAAEYRATAHDPHSGQFTSGAGGTSHIKGGEKSKGKAQLHGSEASAHKSYGASDHVYLHNAEGKRDPDGVYRAKKYMNSDTTKAAHTKHGEALELSAKAHKSGKHKDHVAAHHALGEAIKAHEHAAKTAAHPDIAHHHMTYAKHAKEAQLSHEK